jgi:hypothetical protein
LLTSQSPIFRKLAGKFEAFSRSLVVRAPDLISFFMGGEEMKFSITGSTEVDFAFERIV